MPKHTWDDDQPPLSKWQEEVDLEQHWQRKLQQARENAPPIRRVGPTSKPPSAIPQPPTKRSTSERKRGPKQDVENHAKVAQIVRAYGHGWTTEDNLSEICESLDKGAVPVPKPWPTLKEHPARSWLRALEWHRELVKKAITYHCKAAQGSGDGATS